MRILLVLSVAVFAVPDRPDRTPQELRPPQEQILGDWVYCGDGKTNNPPAVQRFLVFRITATETVWLENGQPKPDNGFTAKVTFDWSKSPVAIDMMPKHGGASIRGIVKLEGDRLTLAWSHNETRPANFDMGPLLHHFTRVKN